MAKNHFFYKVPESIKIQRLSNSCTSKDFNKQLYPIRAVKIYLKEQNLLEVLELDFSCPLKEIMMCRSQLFPMGVNFTIKMAFFSSGNMNYFRAMSASWAYYNFTPLEVSKTTVLFDLLVQHSLISIRDFQEQI